MRMLGDAKAHPNFPINYEKHQYYKPLNTCHSPFKKTVICLLAQLVVLKVAEIATRDDLTGLMPVKLAGRV